VVSGQQEEAREVPSDMCKRSWVMGHGGKREVIGYRSAVNGQRSLGKKKFARVQCSVFSGEKSAPPSPLRLWWAGEREVEEMIIRSSASARW
jgi:hypothetical protein